MGEVTDFTAIDSALSDVDGLGAAVDAIETTAAGDAQTGQAFRKRYQKARTLAERLAKLIESSSGNRVQKLVERW